MAATTLPRIVRTSVCVTAGILLALAAVAAVAWDVRTLILTTTLASLAACARCVIYLADKIDSRMAAIRESARQREAALVGVIEQLTAAVGPEPETAALATELRAVAS